MMFFGKKPPSSVSAAPSHLLPRGEKGADWKLSAQSPSPLVGEGARRADEGAFEATNCAIWNDIRRALEGGAK